MLDIMITVFVLALIGLCMIYSLKITDSDSVFDIDRTWLWDFLFSIIVIFVHIPVQFQNKIQDLIGSFAYIGVSYFCMKAAYGIEYSYNNKKDYFKTFWKHKIEKLLLPLIIVCIIDIVRCLIFFEFSELCLIYYDSIYGWIRILFLYYFEFYFLFFVSDKLQIKKIGKYREYLLILLILLQSLMDYILHIGLIKGWDIERIGFIIGIILYHNGDSIKNFILNRFVINLFINFVLTFLLGLMYVKYKGHVILGGFLLRGLLEISFLFLIVIISLKVKNQNYMIKLGNKISYEIYICHPLVFLFLAKLQFVKTSSFFICLTLAVTLVLAYVVSVVSDWWCSILQN